MFLGVTSLLVLGITLLLKMQKKRLYLVTNILQICGAAIIVLAKIRADGHTCIIVENELEAVS